MPTPAISVEANTGTSDTHRPDGSWYNAFAAPPEPAEQQISDTTPPESGDTDPDVSDTPTHSDVPDPRERGRETPWLALLNLQHAELDRLARNNERLMNRIDTLLQIQEREQVLRKQLQNQFEQIKHLSPGADLEAVRREARTGVTEELKPVLLAILEALERFAHKPEGKRVPAEATPPSDPLHFEDYGKLPAILTRPLDELVEDRGDPERSANGGTKQQPRKTPFGNRQRPRTATRDSNHPSVPGPFTWTTVLSS